MVLELGYCKIAWRFMSKWYSVEIQLLLLFLLFIMRSFYYLYSANFLHTHVSLLHATHPYSGSSNSSELAKALAKYFCTNSNI